MYNAKTTKLSKTRFAFKKVTVTKDAAVSFDTELPEEKSVLDNFTEEEKAILYGETLLDDEPLEETDEIYEAEENEDLEEEPEDQERPIFISDEPGGDVFEEETLTPKEKRKLKRKQKAVEKLRAESEKKAQMFARKESSESSGKKFSLFKESEESPEDKRRRQLYERINADGYYNEILPIDYDEKLEREKKSLSKNKLYLALAFVVVIAVIVVSILYLLRDRI